MICEYKNSGDVVLRTKEGEILGIAYYRTDEKKAINLASRAKKHVLECDGTSISKYTFYGLIYEDWRY